VEFALFNRFYPVPLARINRGPAVSVVDRSHNHIFDTLITTGLAGFMTRQILLILLFALGLRMLNMMPGRREFTLFVGLWIGFGLAGGACAVVFAGPGMSGPGMGFSIAFGVIAYLFVSTRFRPVQTKRDIMAPYQVVLVVSLMSAIFGHLIELQTGI